MTEEKVGKNPERDLPGDAQELDDIITLVLTADNHLGSTAFGQQPRKREELQQRLRHAFQQATDFAIGQGVDLFVQAGDLFDTINPSERERSFVAARLAQLRQAGIRAFAVGGVHDTPAETHSYLAAGASDTEGTAQAGENTSALAPQISYARLGALNYFAPHPIELEPVTISIRNMLVTICGLGVLAGQEGNPLARLFGGQEGATIQNDIERADVSLLILHAPIEGLATGSSLLDTRAQVSRASIENQLAFRNILAGYHHTYAQLHAGGCDVIIAGATQHIDFSNLGAAGGPEERSTAETAVSKEPGFVFLGLGTSGIRWCKHIAVDALLLQRLIISTSELWSRDADLSWSPSTPTPTDIILERLRPLCGEEAMVQLRLEGQLTRNQYHQLDLNRIRRYGEEHCFALAIDDSGLDILPLAFLDFPGAGEEVSGSQSVNAASGEEDSQLTPFEEEGGVRSIERFSAREELVSVADEWIAAANDEQEKKALLTTKEELLAAMDEVRGSRLSGSGMNYNYSLAGRRTVMEDGRRTVMDDGRRTVMDDGRGMVMEDGRGEKMEDGRGQAVAPTIDEEEEEFSAEQNRGDGLFSSGGPMDEDNALPC